MVDNQQIVSPGKIVTIVFNSTLKRPIHVSIKNGIFKKRKDAVYISPLTPLAKAITNRRAGEKVEFDSPEGKLGIKIIGIKV